MICHLLWLQGRPKLRQHIPEADPQEAAKGRALLAVSAALEEVRDTERMVCW
jgi:hypothetical protein